MKKVIILFLILLVVFLPCVSALGLRGDRLSPIIFVPEKKIVNHYVIEGTDKKVNVTLGGELLQYIAITPVVNNEFDLIIDMPAELPQPGEYGFSLHATEVGQPEQPGVSSFLSVNLIFTVRVPPHGKNIDVSLTIPDVNEHETVPVTVNVESRGLENITSLKGVVTIYDQKNNSVASLNLKETSLLALESTTLDALLPADKLPPATYHAEAVISYDQKEARAKDAFKIGNLDLILVDYSSELQPGFAEFHAAVENNWGNPIQTAYAKVSINETELLTTPTVSLGPWQRGELKGILKTDFKPGNYSGSIQLFYDDLSKTEKVIFSILEPPKPEQDFSILLFILIGVMVSLLAIAIVILVLRKKKK